MSGRLARRTIDGVEIRVELDHGHPPSGHLWLQPEVTPDGVARPEDVPFTGWLDLLRALEDVLRTGADDEPPGGS